MKKIILCLCIVGLFCLSCATPCKKSCPPGDIVIFDGEKFQMILEGTLNKENHGKLWYLPEDRLKLQRCATCHKKDTI